MATHNKSKKWYNLDNAAILYPAISDERNTNVFRLSCELNDLIDKDILELAVKAALNDFPFYQVVIRRGLFWFYLEETDIMPQVKEELQRPCKRIFYKNLKDLLFNVTYYKNRINLEMFHAIADGRGGFEFLRTITYNYIKEYYGLDTKSLPVLDRAAPPSHRVEDSFKHHYDPKAKKNPFKEKAYCISGTLMPLMAIRIINGTFSAREFLKITKAKNVTITAYLAALLICSIYSGLMPKRAESKTIGINVPVDLRGYFKSETTRNFFTVVEVTYNFAGDAIDFDKVLYSIDAQLKEKVTPEKLAARMSYNMSVQSNITARFTPLFLKNIILKLAYKKGEKATTAVISNLGIMAMPSPMDDYIKNFTALAQPTKLHRLKACICTYKDDLNISFTSCIQESKAEQYFFRHLAGLGLDITVSGNGGIEDEIL